MGLQKHTPEEKDKMVSRIDELRFTQGKTLPDACVIVAKEMKKTAGSVKSLYNYWKAVQAKKPYLTPAAKRARGPSAAKQDELARAIQTAINDQGPTPSGVNKGVATSGPSSSRRDLLERLLKINERIVEELLNAKDQSTDYET